MTALDVAIFLDRIPLAHGGHNGRGTPDDPTVCATEAVAWLAGEPHTDHPRCLSPILGAWLRAWNDNTDQAGRDALKPYLPRCVGTAGDGHDELRGWLCADWMVRVHTPAWLELAGITDSATVLRALPPLRDLAGLETTQPVLGTARTRAAASWDASRAASRDASRDASWDASWDASRAASWAASRDASRAASWAASWDASWAASWAASRDASWDASVKTEGSYEAKYKAARAAADAVLQPTVVALKASALELLGVLIDPSSGSIEPSPDHGEVT